LITKRENTKHTKRLSHTFREFRGFVVFVVITMIEITEIAARKIRTLMQKQGITDGGLRVGVKGGGCSGLSYTFAWEKQPRLGDEVFAGPQGAKIFIDKKSLLYLNGTVLDYDTNMISKGFVFNNPNAKTTCGCGSSFGA
jgi:iron-sulfur cluster assembly protein